METPLQITFRGFEHTPDLDQLIRRRAAQLEGVAGNRLTSCHVVVELGHEHFPGARIFHVKVDVTFAGAVVVIDRERHDDRTHEDATVAVHDAFDAARRKLEHVDRQRHAAT